MKIINLLKNNSIKYLSMKIAARFSPIRFLYLKLLRLLRYKKTRSMLKSIEGKDSVFGQMDVDELVKKLNRDGVALGLRLPSELVCEIKKFALENKTYADRNVGLGFYLKDKLRAEENIGKKILISQYYNLEKNCNVVSLLKNDPLVLKVAALFLGTSPVFQGYSLWWTFPVEATEEDRKKHAHYFHRDVDDFKFIKFFFYITEVEGDGEHVVVLGSHLNRKKIKFKDNFIIRRYEDAEIEKVYSKDKILKISGKQGEGFIENTYCIHKGTTPERSPRLLLQLEFGVHDYQVQGDVVDEKNLKDIKFIKQ